MQRPDLPWQVKVFAGGGEGRMPAYKVAMVLGGAACAWWYYASNREVARKQEEAADKFGAHGEKTSYGDPGMFKQGVSGSKSVPGLPATEGSAAGSQAGGTKSGP